MTGIPLSRTLLLLLTFASFLIPQIQGWGDYDNNREEKNDEKKGVNCISCFSQEIQRYQNKNPFNFPDPSYFRVPSMTDDLQKEKDKGDLKQCSEWEKYGRPKDLYHYKYLKDCEFGCGLYLTKFVADIKSFVETSPRMIVTTVLRGCRPRRNDQGEDELSCSGIWDKFSVERSIKGSNSDIETDIKWVDDVTCECGKEFCNWRGLLNATAMVDDNLEKWTNQTKVEWEELKDEEKRSRGWRGSAGSKVRGSVLTFAIGVLGGVGAVRSLGLL